MRDPRLAELELLMKLDREGPFEICVPKGSSVTMFGLKADPLREMLAEFFDKG